MTYRILITGSRDWDRDDVLAFHLGVALGEAPTMLDVVIVHGACPTGADALADGLAKHYGIAVESHLADWQRYGRAAGFRRNAEMVALGADVCLAFILNGSKGATHCANAAEAAGIPVRRFARSSAQ